jgi:hypothetical protein
MNMIDQIRACLKLAEGHRCWHVSVGGCTLPTFQLILGAPIKRSILLNNPEQPEMFQSHTGKYQFLIWCSWRLEQNDQIIVSSDGHGADIVTGVHRLMEKDLLETCITGPAWDLKLQFSDGYKVVVFCDHTDTDPSFDGNWDALIDDVRISAGPGSKIQKETVGD